MQNLHRDILAEAKYQLALNLDLVNLLQGNTPLEMLAAVREEWVEPLERLIQVLESRRSNPRISPSSAQDFILSCRSSIESEEHDLQGHLEPVRDHTKG